MLDKESVWLDLIRDLAAPEAHGFFEDGALYPAGVNFRGNPRGNPEATQETPWWALTMDTTRLGRHLPRDAPPEALATMSLARNLCDMAALGAKPEGYLLSFAVPAAWAYEELKRFRDRLARFQAFYGFQLLGGDTQILLDPEEVGFTTVCFLGTRRGPLGLARRHIQAGDALFMTPEPLGRAWLGFLAVSSDPRCTPLGLSPSGAGLLAGETGAGGGAAGLAAAELYEPETGPRAAEKPPDVQAYVRHYVNPTPHLALGRQLAEHRAALTDCSDGLAVACQKFIQASGLHLTLSAGSLPLAVPLLRSRPEDLNEALAFGGDYNLLVAMAAEEAGAFMAGASRKGAGRPLIRIGRFEANRPGRPGPPALHGWPYSRTPGTPPGGSEKTKNLRKQRHPGRNA